MGANQEQIEIFIANIANSPYPEKLIDAANQIAQISMSESIPLDALADHIKRRQEVKQRLEEEIKQRRAILESTNVDIMTLKGIQEIKKGIKRPWPLHRRPSYPFIYSQDD